MEDFEAVQRESRPLVVQRHCGGWLAIAPRDSVFKIAVTSDSSDGAITALNAALDQWARTLALGSKGDANS